MFDTRGRAQRSVTCVQIVGLVLCDIAILMILMIVPLTTWLLLT
jgi:hypothetical protein